MTKRILIVDDEADVRAIAQMGLEMSANWTVQTAPSGAQALALATAEPPDAILLDMMMPEMDGPATLQALKANPTTAAIPVILLTAKARSSHLKAVEDLPATAVIAKPFRPLELAQQLRTSLGW